MENSDKFEGMPGADGQKMKAYWGKYEKRYENGKEIGIMEIVLSVLKRLADKEAVDVQQFERWLDECGVLVKEKGNKMTKVVRSRYLKKTLRVVCIKIEPVKTQNTKEIDGIAAEPGNQLR